MYFTLPLRARIYVCVYIHVYVYVYEYGNNPFTPSGHYLYHQFNIQQFYVLPHTLLTCFVWISEQTAIISLYSID
jgi:hypothetical protein